MYPTLHTQPVTFGAAAGEFLIAAQSTHAAGPVAFLYFPATHATQTSPVFPVYPGPHAHSALPLCDTLFAWHARHADVPAIRLYVPAGHAWHAPGVPVKPGLHWQAALPATETVLLGHAAHVVLAKYVFARQAEQLRVAVLEQFDAPANEYKPLAHVKQLLILVAPTTLDDVPVGQCTHAPAAPM